MSRALWSPRGQPPLEKRLEPVAAALADAPPLSGSVPPPPTHGHVALYLRVSTPQQSTEGQERDLLARIQAHLGAHHAPPYPPLEVYREVMSGARGSRPQIARLLQAARAGKVREVWCWSLDRLMRSLAHFLDLMLEFRSWGVTVHTVKEGTIDWTTAVGRLYGSLFALFAEFERERIRERVLMGVATARARGVRPGPKPDADLIRRAAGMLLGGVGVQEVAAAVGLHRSSIWRLKRRLDAGTYDPDAPGPPTSQNPPPPSSAGTGG